MNKDIAKKIGLVSNMNLLSAPTADNPYFNSKYVPLQAVMEALKEPLAKAGLAYTFSVDKTEAEYEVRMYVIDLDTGESEITGVFPIMEMGPQKIGSTISYARRYLLMATFNIAPELDDDGNEAQGLVNKAKALAPKKPGIVKAVPRF